MHVYAVRGARTHTHCKTISAVGGGAPLESLRDAIIAHRLSRM